ncbi:MerR family transcriptional regulator [Tropicibacter sp. R15_0]|uniref:MerR family transcriptional regulator n=1 Tax=Tropicibacter sp. R15_0 TaxID=2821101 RepID=UPI001ADD5815|nr:MerR family transcriptional regulator [Tropicibacter sp. R15_0]MBO9465526.1 MerR family transcriptional regulator [Tropicibacter sp. R15_0]
MTPKDAALHLGISQRMLRHYESAGLMAVGRTLNGYRHYSPSDLRRAARIRDFIATGFSTREIYAMRACLSDDGSGPCEGGIAKMTEKLESIDRLMAELQERRATVLDRLQLLEAQLDSESPRPEPQPA